MNTPTENAELLTSLMRELALATTNYHEAPPERFEAARIEYEVALQRFRAVRGEEAPRVMAAGRSFPIEP